MYLEITEDDYKNITEFRTSVFTCRIGRTLYQLPSNKPEFLIITQTPKFEWSTGLPNLLPYVYNGPNSRTIITSEFQFRKNLYSGKYLENICVLMHTVYGLEFEGGVLNHLSTANIIGELICSAERLFIEGNVTDAGVRVYFADELIRYRIPAFDITRDQMRPAAKDIALLSNSISLLKEKFNKLVENNVLLKYPKCRERFNYQKMLLDANNIDKHHTI